MDILCVTVEGHLGCFCTFLATKDDVEILNVCVEVSVRILLCFSGYAMEGLMNHTVPMAYCLTSGVTAQYFPVSVPLYHPISKE